MFVKDRQFYVSFFSLAIPVMLQNIILFAVNLLANLMIGGYSELSISATAVALQVQFMLHMLSAGIAEGLVVICAQYWGQKRILEIKSIVGLGVKLQALLGLLFFVLVFAIPRPIASLITDNPAVLDEAVQYLRIACFSYLCFCLTTMLVSFMRVVETVKVGVMINCVALVLSFSLNYILIYGRFGAPQLGIRGAAIAALISRVVELATAVIYVLRFDRKLCLNWRDFVRIDFSFLKDFLRVGCPVLLGNLVWAVASITQTAIVGRMGAQALAASGIADTLYRMVFVAIGAVGSVSGIVIGKMIGRNDFGAIKQTVRTLQVLYLMIGVVCSSILYFSRGAFLSFYNISPDTYALTDQFLIILCFMTLGAAYQVPCLTGIVRGGGDTKFVLINDTIFQWLIGLPLSALAAFVFHLPAPVVFFLLKSDQVTKCLVAAVKINRYRWIKVLTREL